MNGVPVRARAEFVLYWMTSFRRLDRNFALQRAVDWCRELSRPLLVFEVLKGNYPWASPRFHQFVIDGILEKIENWNSPGAAYYPFVEDRPGSQRGLLPALASRSCVVVTDDYPCFFIPQMLVRAARLPVALEAVDSNGLLPLAASPRAFSRAYDFRRFLQRQLPLQLEHPLQNPLAQLPRLTAGVPAGIREQWPGAGLDELRHPAELYRRLALANGPAVTSERGGTQPARRRLEDFLRRRLERYSDERNQPASRTTSGLSPYLHFGFISADEVFQAVLSRAGCRPAPLESARGQVDDWWPSDPSSREFLDQFLTWRELGFNFCHHRSDYDRFDSLPAWARTTLAEHESDPRPHCYSSQELERAATFDSIWNAAQTQLVQEGIIHNYLRMLWGKKILEWSPTPRRALEVMIDLNNKYGLDGRDPNSYSGIFWCLGRYDRAWGPERPIFGKVRYMSSESAARKLKLKPYLERYSPGRS